MAGTNLVRTMLLAVCTESLTLTLTLTVTLTQFVTLTQISTHKALALAVCVVAVQKNGV